MPRLDFPYHDDAACRSAAHAAPDSYNEVLLYDDDRGRVRRHYHPNGEIEDPQRIGDFDYQPGSVPQHLRYDETVIPNG